MLPKNRADFIVMNVFLIIIIGATTGGVLLHIRNQSIEMELKQKEQQLTRLKQELESIGNTASRNPETITRGGNQSEPLVPFDHQQQEIFKEELERLAQDHHLKIIKFEPASTPFVVKDNPEYQVSQWQFVVNGEYRGLVEFLEVLPRNVRLVMIAKLKITPEYLTGNQYQLIAHLTLDVISNAIVK